MQTKIKINTAKASRKFLSDVDIAWVTYSEKTQKALTFNKNSEFLATNHLQSLIKFGVELEKCAESDLPETIIEQTIKNQDFFTSELGSDWKWKQ